MIISTGLFTTLIIAVPFIAYVIYSIGYKKNRNIARYVFLFLLFIYLIFLVKYAIFPIYLDSEINEIMGSKLPISDLIKKHVNVIPLFRGLYVQDFFLNIIMTMPIGFLIPCLKDGLNTRKMVKVGLFIGIGIEMFQFIIMLVQGFTFRDININDVIANVIGVSLGYKIFIFALSICYKTFKQTKCKQIDRLGKYILKMNRNILHDYSDSI